MFFFVFRTLYNYMMWHVVKSLTLYLSKPFKDARNQFMKALTGACWAVAGCQFI